MCGIAAIFGKVPSSSVIDKMTDSVRHRGPDGRGVKTFGSHAALGHRRLSILDLSAHGSQPMSTEDGRFHIVYNGEIYNYLELKRELEKKGCRFHSHCDTEALLNAYAIWGQKCLPRLNGMFAFVIYDSEKKTFFAARDRFGIKPLYYRISPKGYIAFASEIKQFSVFDDWKPALDHQLAYDFLNWSIHDHTEGTLFADVKQLRGGECLEGPSLRKTKWYTLPKCRIPDEPHEHFQKLLKDSVRLRLRADVDVGSCLSGGLDSSSIVCLIHDILKEKNNPGKQKTFSACCQEERFDERRFVDIVTAKTKHQAYYTYPGVEVLFEDLDKIIWHHDEPFGSTSIFAQWEVFKLAREQNVTVILDGQGADEQLAGYTASYGFYFEELLRSLSWRKLLREMKLSKETLGSSKPYQLLANRMLPESIRTPLKKIIRKPTPKPNWLFFDKRHAQDIDPISYPGTLPEYCRTMIETSSLPMLLHYEDRDSMAFSIEARTPFLDYRLVELSANLHAGWLMADGMTKRILREAMRGIIPDPIRARRDKIGFATPEPLWLKHPEWDRLLKDGIEKSEGLISPSVLEEFFKVKEGRSPFTTKFFRIISFSRWLEIFNVSL